MKYIFLILVFCQSLTTRAQSSDTATTLPPPPPGGYPVHPTKYYLLRFRSFDSQMVGRPDSMTVETTRTYFDQDFVQEFLKVDKPSMKAFDHIEIVLLGDRAQYDTYRRTHKRWLSL